LACASDTEPAALVAALAQGDAELAATAPSQRRVALVLDGATPNEALAVLRALAQAGYRVVDLPASADELATRLAKSAETLMCNDYAAYFANLPRELRDRVASRWGAAELDPCFRAGEVDCGRFDLRALRLGNVAVAAPDAASGATPPHRRLALEAWLADSFRAQAVLHLGSGRTV
jgi:cobaltochelatase CobN